MFKVMRSYLPLLICLTFLILAILILSENGVEVGENGSGLHSLDIQDFPSIVFPFHKYNDTCTLVVDN